MNLNQIEYSNYVADVQLVARVSKTNAPEFVYNVDRLSIKDVHDRAEESVSLKNYTESLFPDFPHASAWANSPDAAFLLATQGVIAAFDAFDAIPPVKYEPGVGFNA